MALALVQAAGAAQPAIGDGDDESADDLDAIVVTATRSDQLVRDQPLRVEVVPDEEIRESLTVAPGNLTNILNELAGVRMQSTAPGLGGTGLQFRGLPGRHAQILSDGLPLAGAQSDSFSLMQTPPVDLRRVEVIKGVASALYGASALSGVLNLTSREPGEESEALLNQTSRGGSDLVGFLAGPGAQKLGYTLIGGAHYQSQQDPDHDGWAEIPGYTRATLRPRIFWNDGEETTLFGTLGLMSEDRNGGSRNFPEELHSQRVDAGAIASLKLSDTTLLSARGSTTFTERDRVYGITRLTDRSSNVFGEVTLQGHSGVHNWLAGAALSYESLRAHDAPGVSYSYTVPGVFAQDEIKATSWLSLSASARVDDHSDYGTFFSPRVSALVRAGGNSSIRVSAGTGFSAPTPLIEEVEARSLGLVNPLRGLRAERAQSASLDMKWAMRPLDINVSVFASEVRNPLDVEAATQPGRLDLINDSEPLRSRGAELLIGIAPGELHVLINATYLDVTEGSETDVGRRVADRIPRFTSEIATILEDEALGRVGVEIAYTGSQRLWDDPFATRSPSFVEINALAEINVGRAAIFLNALNLTNVKQQDTNPLLRPSPGLGGNPITDAWAPLVGRTFNLGVRLK